MKEQHLEGLRSPSIPVALHNDSSSAVFDRLSNSPFSLVLCADLVMNAPVQHLVQE